MVRHDIDPVGTVYVIFGERFRFMRSGIDFRGLQAVWASSDIG